jgi:hypothetical protein
MPSDEFAPPAVPAASNDAGPPVTPSGAHASNPAATLIIKTEGGKGLPQVPEGAGSNVIGTPQPPSHASEGDR